MDKRKRKNKFCQKNLNNFNTLFFNNLFKEFI